MNNDVKTSLITAAPVKSPPPSTNSKKPLQMTRPATQGWGDLSINPKGPLESGK